MKCLFALVASVLCGCSATSVKLQAAQDFQPAVLYFSEPGQPKVRVFEVSDSKGGGGGVTDFGQMPEPLYLHPGDIRVTFGCLGDKEFSYSHFTNLTLPKAGNYFLFCNSERLLGVRPMKSLPN